MRNKMEKSAKNRIQCDTGKSDWKMSTRHFSEFAASLNSMSKKLYHILKRDKGAIEFHSTA